jgi:hypothetical protein
LSEGIYRRRIRIQAAGLQASAALEDDFHRFSVDLGHDGTHIRSVKAHSHRFPWTACPGAAAALESLVGLELSASPLELRRFVEVSMMCTHQLDLAMLAAAHAAAQIPQCQYDVAVTVDGDQKEGVLHRDGAQALAWRVMGLHIVDPPPYAGRDLRQILAWALRNCSPAELEAIIVMRRAIAVARGRTVSLDDFPTAAYMLGTMSGTCHTFQPDTAVLANRMMGTTRKFDADPDALLR